MKILTNYFKKNFEKYLQEEVWQDLKFANKLNKIPSQDRSNEFWRTVGFMQGRYCGRCLNPD